MLQVILFILSVALATVDGWGACNVRVSEVIYNIGRCTTFSTGYCAQQFGPVQCKDRCFSGGTWSGKPCGNDIFVRIEPYGSNQSSWCSDNTECGTSNLQLVPNVLCCNNQCEADSIACMQNGGTFVRNGEQCECKTCDQQDTSYTEVTCAYDIARGQYLNIANTVTIVNCEATVEEHQYYSNTCDSNCTENSDLTCLGTVDGYNVYLRSCNGRVTKCEADGSCDMAIRKIANGECENPNDPPNPNSSSGAGSSSSGVGSSGSGNSSGSGEDWEWLKDSLHVIHVENITTNEHLGNMQPFIAGTYDQVTDLAGTAHDINSNLLTGFDFLNDIKQNTGNTANNTNGINNKLSTTNSLLEQINNKNWHPTINVSSPSVTVEGDTNIINVQGDTAKAPFEILQFLKGLFGGSDTTGNFDTTGFGGITDTAKNELDSTLLKADFLSSIDCDTTGGRKCDDKIIGAHGLDSAAGRLRTAYRGVVDSLKNGAFGDSLNEWGSKFTGNGVIAGSGSANCPSVLTRNYRVDIYQGAGYNFTLGTYLCTPIFGNVTAWALCRILLRASVALACMWFLFKCATGFKGNSGDDE